MSDSLRVGNAQIVGARTDQQDAFGFSDKDDAYFVRHGGVLAVIADGMGGHAYGGEASRIAVKAFLLDYMAKSERVSIPDALYQAFYAANHAVCAFAEEAGEAGNCGTTFVAAVVHLASRSLHWISTGDSRILLFRKCQWVQITADSNYANRLLNHHIHGVDLPYHWKNDIHLQGLTSFLGLQEIEEIDRSLCGLRLHPQDWLVLCTDGIYNTLAENEILALLHGDPNTACEMIVQKVTAKGLAHQDNATVATIACDFNPAHDGRGKWRTTPFVKLGFGLFLISLVLIAYSVFNIEELLVWLYHFAKQFAYRMV